MAEHDLDDSLLHDHWDRDLTPRLEIDAGDTVTFTCIDASGGSVTPGCGTDAYLAKGRYGGHPLTGPVFVRGAEPGDALEVEVIELRHRGWGWNGFRHGGIGLLADEFDAPFLQHWSVDDDGCTFADGDEVVVPYEPFCGVMGVAPAGAGRVETGPPGAHAGNVDVRGLTTGAVASFPIFVPGALFSTGDCHAAQGDGEVCGTGIECPMSVTLRFGVRKGAGVSELRFTTPSPLTRSDRGGWFATTGHGPDLYQDARTAVRSMVDWLHEEHGLSRERAYCLCSVAADLKISEIVDAPNWVVSCYLPLSILRS